MITFEQDFFTPDQEKIAAKAIKEMKKFFKTDHLDYTKYGFNPKSLLDELDQAKVGKDKEELKAIETRRKNIIFGTNLQVKIVFNFKAKLRQIVFMSDTMPTEKYFAYTYTWTALLDFPISTPLLFGRAHKEPAFHKGEYFFAPVDTSLFGDLFTKFDQLLFMLGHSFPDDVVIDLLERIRYSKESFDQMKTMLQLVKKKQATGIDLIDKFNSNGHLIDIMKKVPHFGNSMNLMYRFVSEVDVSTICIPVRNSTLIQIVDFGLAHRKVLDALFALSSALEEFAIEPAEPWRSSTLSAEEKKESIIHAVDSLRNKISQTSQAMNETMDDLKGLATSEMPESPPPSLDTLRNKISQIHQATNEIMTDLRGLVTSEMPESPPPSPIDFEEKKETPVSASDLLREESRQSTHDLPSSEEIVSKPIDIKLDDDPQKRIQQIETLKKDGSQKAVQILIQILFKDEVSEVRAEAATALGMIGDKLLIPVLRRVMNVDRDYNIRAAAVEAIELIERISK